MQLHGKIAATLLFSIALLASGCGGGPTNGGSTPTPTPAPTPTPSTTGEWTWMSGSNTVPAIYEGQPGVYGTLGVAASSNVPGGRAGAVRWTDSSGNFWLFGGWGYDSTGTADDLNDLWEFNPSTKEWTWVSGNTMGATGVYGTKGTESTTNVPSAREGSVSWIDSGGNLWLFGGNSGGDELNDLWEFSPVNKEWTWVSGSMATFGSGLGAVGVYGTQGVASASNVPGGRSFVAAAWIDSSGNLWLFGGDGIDSTGALGVLGTLNDLWEFNPSTEQWTWVNGSNAGVVVPVYGTQGTASTSNTPGGRESAVSWIDGTGNLWLFGGVANDSVAYSGALNDLWKFNPSAKTWTWVSGNSTQNAAGIYGTQGVSSASNVPEARWGAVSWTDSSGNMWCFGGEAYDSTGSAYLNDLWKYTPANNQWTWMGGSNTANERGMYGTLGTPAATNTPGSHFESVSWIDSSGDLWLFGGSGYDSTGTNGLLNDLWRYQP